METAHDEIKEWEFYPVDGRRWDDLVTFFERQEHAKDCWCTYWRLSSEEFGKLSATDRRERLKALVQADVPVGMLAYRQGEPVGWCSIAPRETYAHLEQSRVLARIDGRPTWSVVCFVIDPVVRGQRLPARLLQAGVAYAVAQGATIIEGYPVSKDANFGFMGSPGAFADAGFRDAGVLGKGRKVVRYRTDEKGS